MAWHRRSVDSGPAAAVLSLALAGTAAVKVWSPYDPSFAVSSGVYYGSVVIEAAAALLLWSRFRRVVAIAVLVLLLAVAAYLWWHGGFRSARACGCFGAWHVPPTVHFAVVGMLGLLACITYWCPQAGQVPRQR